MQPYFLPFAGYFRLFAVADEVVLADTVQFPRRGFVHRNRFLTQAGRLDWLSLPIAACPLETTIHDLKFPAAPGKLMAGRVRPFRMFTRDGLADSALKADMLALEGSPLEVIVRLLRACCAALDLPFLDLRASQLDIPPGLAGQERLFAIARVRGATTYVNSPGGRALYDGRVFAARGLDLRFLSDYKGPLESIGQRLHDSRPEVVRAEILGQCALEAA
jgi:hypothetical protein